MPAPQYNNWGLNTGSRVVLFGRISCYNNWGLSTGNRVVLFDRIPVSCIKYSDLNQQQTDRFALQLYGEFNWKYG